VLLLSGRMSAGSSTTSDESRELRALEIRTALAAWALFIAATCIYCLIHQAVVSAVTPNVSRTVLLALREWGAWMFLAPLAFKVFRRADAKNAHRSARYAIACLLMASAAALAPICIDQYTATRSFASSVAIFWPRNAGAAVIVCFIWHVFLRARNQVPATPQGAKQVEASQRAHTLLVSKGADECLIRVEDIQYLSAAGNYIDIYARNQRYLMRGTMAQLEELLPADRFIRIHRSHIVHMEQIERIRIQRSGSGTVHLRCGAVLGISRSYRMHLQRYRPRSLTH
jgi:two-component system LytT family response regulator